MSGTINRILPQKFRFASIGKSFSAAFKEASFVAIQLPRLPAFSLDLTGVFLVSEL